MSRGVILLTVLIIAAVVAVGSWIGLRSDDEPPAVTTSTAPVEETPTEPKATSKIEAKTVTITYDGSRFNPDEITVESGTKVKFVNDSDREIDVESDPHPVHNSNTELNVGAIAPGDSQTVTLTEKGDWGFHDHLNETETGSITVE